MHQEKKSTYMRLSATRASIAVEVAHFTYPAELRSGTMNALVEAMGMFVAIVRRIEKLYKRMLADKPQS
ncbi:hypothetical protein HDU90_008937 [Geranomyces variabilis]|nr:hypothetical protein HDU90_008937 [Geranomyces variabilis]